MGVSSAAHKFVQRRGQQTDLVASGQPLDGRFPSTGATAAVPALEVDHLHRTAPAEIPGAAAVGMLCTTPGEVIGNSRVERGIGTENDINLPVHPGYVIQADRTCPCLPVTTWLC
jgi:hypothetical protein